MLVYAAIIPHPPFVIEGLRHDRRKELQHTMEALDSVGQDIRSLDVDTIVLLTTHGERYERALSIALHDPYEASLHAFGDLREHGAFQVDVALADRMKRAVRHSDYEATMTTNDVLDAATSVPLIYLKPYIQDKRFLVLTPPTDTAKRLVGMGSVLRQTIEDSTKRVAVLAVAELSHRLSELSPGGVVKQAPHFDEGIRNALKDSNTMALLRPDQDEMEAVGGEELDVIRLFWGLLDDTEHRMEERSYEHPFGIGHLVMVAHVH